MGYGKCLEGIVEQKCLEIVCDGGKTLRQWRGNNRGFMILAARGLAMEVVRIMGL